jgi:hypothetical protein
VTDTAAPARPRKVTKTAFNAGRSFWLRQLHQWQRILAMETYRMPPLVIPAMLAFPVSARAQGETVAAGALYAAVMDVLP